MPRKYGAIQVLFWWLNTTDLLDLGVPPLPLWVHGIAGELAVPLSGSAPAANREPGRFPVRHPGTMWPGVAGRPAKSGDGRKR